ncbi:YidB family protein [Methylophilus aquaticus]|uniref:YidB family protein n=1 Tax=Methylophilus aquaticus TaxID=1971610 RepID=A0ABT9JTN7_9PROT|nr:YidB family protein [Methylophilus aquaticus]MDP8567908.1 YidB family protein [Methylophilus aquaticus]
MGLFDNVAGAMMNKMMGEKAPLAKLAMELFQQYGGLPGILQTLKHGGLDAQVDSWVGSGANLKVDAQQIGAALGSSVLAGIAGKLDMTTEQLSQKIAEYLPDVVNQLTPNGVVENNPALIMSRLMGMLK